MVKHGSSKSESGVRFPSISYRFFVMFAKPSHFYYSKAFTIASIAVFIQKNKYINVFFIDHVINWEFLKFFTFFIALSYFLSIFFFIGKKTIYRYNNVDDRFWKRTLGLFWSIELFLLFIYYTLWLFSPTEVQWGIDTFQEFIHQNIYMFYYFKETIYNIFLFITLNIIIFSKYFNFILFTCYLIFLNVYILSFFKNDFRSLFYISSIYHQNVLIYEYALDEWDIDKDHQKKRTIRHYILLIVILKVFHNYFFFFFYIIVLSFFIRFFYVSTTYISAIRFNYIFIFIICFFFYTSLIRDYFNFYFDQVYKSFVFFKN